MHVIDLGETPCFETWRNHARRCLHAQWPPHQLSWQGGAFRQASLFVSGLSEPEQQEELSAVRISRSFLDEASVAFRHSDTERFALLYRLLWRLVYQSPNLLAVETDPDVMAFNRLVRGVRRDAYKIKAFLRFRETCLNDEPWFVAWIEPEFDSLPLALPFFVERFANMRWAILTPTRCARWDTQHLVESPAIGDFPLPDADGFEDGWLTYYASTFNPARVKVSAMLNAMPKKYWKTMPETRLIAGMLRQAPQRVQQMVAQQHPLAAPSTF